jgi:hypothetical protein
MEKFVCRENDSEWKLERLWNLQENKQKSSIQSTAFVDGILYVFYHDSIIQQYVQGTLEDEYSPTSGVIHHANDTEYDGKDFIIVDTGTKDILPMLKRYDPKRHVVLQEWNILSPGWRTAAASFTVDKELLVIMVEAIALEKRTKMSLRTFNLSSDKTVEIASLPHWHKYVQGCAVRGNDLFITTNDGGSSEKTRFIDYDLRQKKIIHDVSFEGFGESEGMFCTADGHLLTGRNMRNGKSAVYRLVTPGEMA